MADTNEINNGQDVDNQNPENDIKEILNSYDINKKKENDNVSKINNTDWSLVEGILEEKSIKEKAVIDVDKYWNFNGYVSPKIDVEFYVGVEKFKEDGTKKIVGKWININKLSDDLVYKYKDKETEKIITSDIANNNNYIVSANISDYGPKELELVLYDRNFTDLQKLISSSISFIDEELNKNDDVESDFTAEVIEGNEIKFLTSPAKITTNIRLRYGYNEDKNTTVKISKNYSGVNNKYYRGKNQEETYRWASTETSNETNENNQSLKTDTTLTEYFQQSTLFSNWQYFVIVGIGSNLTNTGIKYTIKGISTEEFALNGYKMYQQYSVIKGKPKTIMSTLMNIFNTKENSPIKLIWADEEVSSENAPINGEDLLINYETGKYTIVNETEIENAKKEIARPLNDLQEYIKMLTDIKACFTYIEENTLKSYVDGKSVEYNPNIDYVTNYEFGELSKEAPEREYIDFAMWPLYADSRHEDYILNSIGYGKDLVKMAMFQNEVSNNISYLKRLKLNMLNKNAGNDRPCVVRIKDLIKIWLANIAIEAYNLNNLEPPTSISKVREAEERKENSYSNFGIGHYMLVDEIDKLNKKMPIIWKIVVPELLNNSLAYVNGELLKKDSYYIPIKSDYLESLSETEAILFNGIEITKEMFLDKQNLYDYDSFQAVYDDICEIKLSGLDEQCKNLKKDDDNNYPLKLMKSYCHNNVVNNIEFFKDDFNILNKLFDKWSYLENTIINVKKVKDFYLEQIEGNGIPLSTSLTLYDALNVLGSSNVGIKESKIGILRDLRTYFNDFYNFCRYTHAKLLKDIIEFKGCSTSSTSSKPFQDYIFKKIDGKYITNGFTPEDIKAENITIVKDLKIIDQYHFKLKFKEANGKYNYFYGELDKKVGDYFWNNKEELEIVKEHIAVFIRSVISFSLNILNKDKKIKVPKIEEDNKVNDYIDVEIFKGEEVFGNLKIPKAMSSERLDVNNEYFNFLVNTKEAIVKKYKSKLVKNKDIKELYDDYINKEEISTSEKEDIKKQKIKVILEGFIKEIEEKDTSSTKIIKLYTSEDDKETFGGDTNNLLEKAFNIADGLSIISDKEGNEKEITEFLKKVDSKLEELNEKLKNINDKSQRINNSNVGKEIELSLGSQESRNTNSKPLTKTIASLLNDFCSQCMPKISEKEILIKNANTSSNSNTDSDEINNKIIIKDENGDDKTMELYQNIPRYNLTWGVVGHYKTDTPIIGFYYKEPRKISKLRKYNWGTGNAKPHCIKSVNISTGSEFALLHSYNTIMDTSDGQVITSVDNKSKIVRKVDNILPTKSPCFFNQSFDNNRDKNIFNNMINSLSKGTITVLGDPSLRFSGSIQPYTYPIYLNISLSREVPSWIEMNGDIVEQDTTEFSQLSGYYVITKITHNISSSGYITTLEVTKYPGTGDSFIGYAGKS